jgi:hypothetical protein
MVICAYGIITQNFSTVMLTRMILKVMPMFCLLATLLIVPFWAVDRYVMVLVSNVAVFTIHAMPLWHLCKPQAQPQVLKSVLLPASYPFCSCSWHPLSILVTGQLITFCGGLIIALSVVLYWHACFSEPSGIALQRGKEVQLGPIVANMWGFICLH